MNGYRRPQTRRELQQLGHLKIEGVRPRRSMPYIPTSWWDGEVVGFSHRSWKRYRREQYRVRQLA